MKKRPARASSRQHSFSQRVLRRVLHVCWYGVAVVGALVAIALIAARLLLPMVTEKKADLEALIARESGYEVRIGQMEGYWDGLYPGLRMRDLQVFAGGAGRPLIQLAELRFSLQLLPLFARRVDIHSAVLVRPSLSLERLADGRFRISGFKTIEQTDAAQTDALMAWLFRQHRLAIEDGELKWFDRREPARPLTLTHVNLQLENDGERHRMGVVADFPEGICDGCSVVADIDGNPFAGTPLAGELYVRARDVNVERLPWVLREQLPELLRGTFSVELWSDWEQSLPVEVTGTMSVVNLRLPLRELRVPLSVKQASTSLRWRGEPDKFQVTLDDLTLALHETPWSAGKLEFSRSKDRSALHIGRIELADVSAFVASLRLARVQDALPYEESAQLWSALRPTGAIRNLRAEFNGALDAPEDYSITADVAGLSIEAHQQWPGVRGVGGRLWITPDEGEINLDMRDGTLALPAVFREALPVTRASADLRWRYQVDQWVITTDNLTFTNNDVRADGRMLYRLPDDPTISPFLALNMEFRDGRGANAARYYPARHLTPATLAWMEYAFAGGTVTHGTLAYEGNTRDFPFDTQPGKFEIRAKVRDGVYRYLDGWTPATGLVADVAVTGNRFLVTGHGRIGALRARDIVVETGAAGTVRVSAAVSGATDETLRVLRTAQESPGDDEWRQWLAPSLEARGNGALGIQLTVPIDTGVARFRGEYRFLGGDLRLRDTAFQVSAIGGNVGFSDDGMHAAQLRAKFLGGDVAMAVSRPRPNETLAVLQGHATASGLAPLLGARIAPRVGGEVPWSMQWRSAKGRPDISAEVDLSALRTTLPAPLNRADGFGSERLRLRTESAGARDIVLGIDMKGMLQGRMRFERLDGWRLSAGRVILHERPPRLPEAVTLPGDAGLHVLARLDDFDIDRWRAVLGDDGSASPAWLARISASMRRLVYLDRDFGAVNIELAREKTGWVGGVSGATAEGQMRFEFGATTHIRLDLAHLRLPAPLHESSGASAGTGTDPRSLPQLSLRARQFGIDGKDLGELEFLARPVALGWRIDRVAVLRPESRFEASGDWRIEYGQTTSSFSALIASVDIGKTLAALGLPDQVQGTTVDMQARLSWNGPPADIEYASLNGSIELKAKKGRFLKLDQGAARLFGVLDLSAIGRYLTLDFTPVFGKGFAFDDINGRITLERGNAYTDSLLVRGPSARMNFSGRVGMATEDFNLVLDVYPSLSDSLTIGSLVAGGPQVALGAFLIQKLFKKQIEEGTRVTYFVKGPWQKPDITRKLVEVPSADTNPPPN